LTVLLFFLFFGFFSYGASGAIPIYRDSGDLIASAYTLGIAHPPGYPVYLITAKLFHSLIPFGNPAYAMNLLSALWAALALALLYKHLKSQSEMGALCTVVVLGLSPAVVTLARASEMYTLALLFGVMILMSRHQLLSFFLLGLGMGVHPTLILMLPVLLTSPWRKPGPTLISALPSTLISKLTSTWALDFSRVTARYAIPLFMFGVGLSVLLYLPIRAATHPLQNWGDPSSWERFWRVLTRADYGGLKLHPVESSLTWTPESIMAQLSYFVRALSQEWGWAALVIAIIGMWKRWGILLSFLLVGPAFFVFANLPLTEDTTPAILQPYLLLTGLVVAMGVVRAWRYAEQKSRWSALAGVGVLLFTIPHAGWTRAARHDFLAYDYGRNLLRELPKQAVLYDPDDPTSFTLRTLQITENRRRDIIPLNFFRTRWGYQQIRERTDLLPSYPITNGQELDQLLWTYARQRHPFYVELPQKIGTRPYATEGIVYRTYPSDALPSRQRAEDNLERIIRRDFSQTTDYADFFARHLVSYYAAAHCNLGLDYAKAHLYERAAFHYRYALTIDPKMTVAYNNWGNLEFFQQHYPQAIALYQAGLRITPDDRGLQANVQLAKTTLRSGN